MVGTHLGPYRDTEALAPTIDRVSSAAVGVAMGRSTTTQLCLESHRDATAVPRAIDEDRSMPLGASRPRSLPPPISGSGSQPSRRSGSTADRLGSAPDLAVGDRVGRYVIDGRLGEGGMGVVWRALDPEVGRHVALKFVRAATGGVDARLWSRLRREAQALARVRHPNVVGLYDVGSTKHGSYLAMEHLAGMHLRRWLERSARTWQEKVDVMCQVGEGLVAVHRTGIVHRDVKPTNLMVCDDGRVVLLDFGLALGVAEGDTGKSGNIDAEDVTLRTRMTRQNMVVGTTSYMSPEQLLGRELDGRSDQFAFCVTLFEALFGQRPFPGKSPYELALAFEAGERPRIPDRRDVPRHVCGAVMKGLRIDREDRFASMADLLDALRPRRAWGGRWVLAAAGLGIGFGVLGAAVGASLALDAARALPAVLEVSADAAPHRAAPVRPPESAAAHHPATASSRRPTSDYDVR